MSFAIIRPLWLGLLAIAAALFLMSPKANADTRIGAHLGSYHFSGDFNNFNPGVYVYHNGWTAGTYFNSERRQSAYAGYTFEWHLGGRFGAGVTVGAITGYARGPVLPMVVPSVRATITEGLAARLSFVPPVGRGSAAAVHFSIERNF